MLQARLISARPRLSLSTDAGAEENEVEALAAFWVWLLDAYGWLHLFRGGDAECGALLLPAQSHTDR
jgi:hypothetical protein